jgi:transposase-like protein
MAKPSRKGTKSEAEIASEAKRKKEILEKVAQSDLPTKTILKELGISRSTYYSWLKRYEEEGEEGLLDSRSLPKAEEEVKEVSPAVEEKEPEVADVEVVKEESPPEPEAELFEAMEARTPPTEPPTMTPDRPVAAPVKEESEEKQEVVMPKEKVASAGGEKKKGIGLYAFIAILLLILGLLFSVSLSHYNTYELRDTGNTLTLWKGKFAARGFEMVESFVPYRWATAM